MQFTEEKLGKAERTETDPHFEELCKKTDKVKLYTEKLVKDSEAVLVPNPGKGKLVCDCHIQFSITAFWVSLKRTFLWLNYFSF